MKPVIGVLALQGAFHAHAKVVRRLGFDTVEVRTPADLDGANALIIPGGESTTIDKLIGKDGLDAAIRARSLAGTLPLFGTCMGMIVLAGGITGSDQFRMGLIDIDVSRNAYGRQLESFEARVPLNGRVGGASGEPMTCVFIRAPRIVSAGPAVEVLCSHEGVPILVRERDVLCASFHPELTADTRIHEYFISMTREGKA